MDSESKSKTGADDPLAFYTPIELEQVKRELGLSRAELAAARVAADKTRIEKIKSRHRNKFILRVAAAVIMCAAVFEMIFVAIPPPGSVAKVIPSAKGAAVSRPETSALPALAKSNETSAAQALVKGSETSATQALLKGGEVNQAINHLSNAFHLFPDKEENEVVSEASRRYPSESSACRMAWKDGMPALSLGSKGGDALTIATALNGCARAIEKLHSETAQQPQ